MSHLRVIKPVWWVIAAFALVQVAIIFFFANGPFVDEGNYIVAGMRLWQGYGLTDNYIVWFSGSPFAWPFFVGLGYWLGNLEGARLAALVFALLSLIALAQATEILFDERVSAWTILALCLNGLFIALAHFAAYDLLALCCLAFALWLLARYFQKPNNLSLILAAIFLGVGVIAKYPFLLMVPFLGLLLMTQTPRTGRERRRDIFLFAGAVCSIVLLYVVPLGERLSRYVIFAANLNRNFQRDFNLTLVMTTYFVGIPFILSGIGGVWLWRMRRTKLAITLWLGLLQWPIYHLITTNHLSEQKHVVFGFFLSYPLVGFLFQRLWLSSKKYLVPLLLTVLFFAGRFQWYSQEYSWVDLRPAIIYLTRNLTFNDTAAADTTSVFTMSLYKQGLIDTPNDIYGLRAIQRGTANLCETRWLVYVEDEADPLYNAEAEKAIRQCGHLKVFTNVDEKQQINLDGQITLQRNLISIYRLPAP